MFWLNGWEWSVNLCFHGLVLFNALFLILFVFFPENVDSINHLLYKFNFWIAKSMFVRYIIGVTSLSSRFSSSSTWLEVKFFTSCLQFVNTISSPTRKINMDRSSHSSPQICGAWMNVAIFFIQTEFFTWFFLDRFSNSSDSFGQSLKNSFYISTFLHWNNSQLVFLINPDQESFFCIMENSSALRPVPFHPRNCKVSIPRYKEKVVIN